MKTPILLIICVSILNGPGIQIFLDVRINMINPGVVATLCGPSYAAVCVSGVWTRNYTEQAKSSKYHLDITQVIEQRGPPHCFVAMPC